MRRYGELDTKGLVATRNWRDERSASRYAHAVTSEEWDRVERLPSVGSIRGRISVKLITTVKLAICITALARLAVGSPASAAESWV